MLKLFYFPWGFPRGPLDAHGGVQKVWCRGAQAGAGYGAGLVQGMVQGMVQGWCRGGAGVGAGGLGAPLSS